MMGNARFKQGGFQGRAWTLGHGLIDIPKDGRLLFRLNAGGAFKINLAAPKVNPLDGKGPALTIDGAW